MLSSDKDMADLDDDELKDYLNTKKLDRLENKMVTGKANKKSSATKTTNKRVAKA